MDLHRRQRHPSGTPATAVVIGESRTLRGRSPLRKRDFAPACGQMRNQGVNHWFCLYYDGDRVGKSCAAENLSPPPCCAGAALSGAPPTETGPKGLGSRDVLLRDASVILQKTKRGSAGR